jgi:signal transduction histidine kinase
MTKASVSDEFFDLIDVPILFLSADLSVLRLNKSMASLIGLPSCEDDSISHLNSYLKQQDYLWNILLMGVQHLKNGGVLFFKKVGFENLKGVRCQCELKMRYLPQAIKQDTLLLYLIDRTNADKIESRLKDAVQDQIRNEQQLREALKALETLNAEIKAMQDQLIQAEKLQSVGRLAAGVAHEVKNPLAIILQGLEYLERQIDNSNESALEVINDLNEAVRRADDVIRSLLDYATPQDPKMELGNISVAIEKALEMMNQLFKKKSIYVVKEFANDLPQLSFDSNRMHQVFINLFSNALHAMDKEGTLLVRVTKLQTNNNGRYVRVEIKDTGKGIPLEFLSRVFDPFVTSRRGEGGTGLGMSVVKGIIEMHHGLIEIKNHANGGAIVTIDL